MNGLGIFEAIVLGLLQGLTEFLPVSSDGHLAIGAFVFGLRDMPLSFVVVLHLGTLIATLVTFRPDLLALLKSVLEGLKKPQTWVNSKEGQLTTAIVVATLPTGVIGLFLEDRVEAWSRQPWIVGVCLLLSAAAVASTRWARGDAEAPTLTQAFAIGVVQGLAVLPGLSRSGSTIACAMAFGMSGPAAFRYSFLLSLPAVGGAVLLKVLKPAALAGLGTQATIGATVALISGFLALSALRSTLSRGKFWAFSIYLIPLGFLLIALNNALTATP